MNISICRDGVEIGAWSEEEVRSFYREGRLVATDSYWKEGMPEWLSLSNLIRPPPTFPDTPSPQKESDTTAQPPVSSPTDTAQDKVSNEIVIPKHYPGLNRITFIVGFVSTFIIGFGIGMLAVNANASRDDAGLLILRLVIMIVLLYFMARRLQNIGYPGWTCLFALIPFVGFIIFLFCCFCPAGYRNSQEKSAKYPPD